MTDERASDPQPAPDNPTENQTQATIEAASLRWKIDNFDLSTAVLTDRSRTEDGWSWCQRARYIRYHSGPLGYGIEKRAMSMPRVTGTYVHEVAAGMVKVHVAGEELEQRAKFVIDQQVQRYKRLCHKRGFADISGKGIDEAGELTRIIGEQSALIEAFGWALHLAWVPQMLEQFEVVSVEEEVVVELPTERYPRVFAQIRPDLGLRQRADGTIAQVDFKTVGGYLTAPFWRRQWEDNGQLALQSVGLAKLTGQPADFSYVYAFDKQKASKEKGTEIVKQWSPLLYAYRNPGNPPMEPEDWQLKYEWVDELGQTRRVGKKHQRVEVRSFDFGQPAGTSSTEWWVRTLAAAPLGSAIRAQFDAQREVLGPYQVDPGMRERMLTAVAEEELRWQEKLWRVHEAGEAVAWDESHPEFQATLDREVPQSWQCHRYGKDCQFLSICRREQGWEAPLESGAYVQRRPHHEPELLQMKLRGIEPPEDEAEEDDRGE